MNKFEIEWSKVSKENSLEQRLGNDEIYHIIKETKLLEIYQENMHRNNSKIDENRWWFSKNNMSEIALVIIWKYKGILIMKTGDNSIKHYGTWLKE
jgi:hypothetical protein